MRRALVTGASGPIGAAAARRIAAAGRHVIVHANSNVTAAEAIRADITAAGGSAETLVLDLMADDAMDRIGALAADTPVDIVVHCAGGQRDALLVNMDRAEWDHVIGLNLGTVFTVLRPLIKPMMRARWGRIVTVSSLAATRGNPGQANYSAAKGALHALSRTLTREYGKRGITANVVAPGLIDTEETRRLANYAELVALSPNGRAGTPDEVAAVIAFLVSEEAAYVSSQLISVDGGAA